MNFIHQFDQYFFYFFNTVCHLPFLDSLATLWRNPFFWSPLYVFFISFLFLNFELKKSAFFIFCLAVLVACSDFTSSSIIKKAVQRVRPCREKAMDFQVKKLIPCGTGYSFPSSHAANHFAIAVFVGVTLGRRWKWLKFLLIFWATSISIAQIYVGVHYPTDILAGAFLGTILAVIFLKIFQKINIFDIKNLQNI